MENASDRLKTMKKLVCLVVFMNLSMIIYLIG